ncbi:MAG: PTS transporter subunit EIIC, partial [Lachnospiraceae bacterium]|nr:PTS transporter subunit EIIC [Lachnospiraceae bacterium]
MKDKTFSVLQRVGRSFMLPIAILPVAGLLLGIGSSFTNATTIETYGLSGVLGEGTILHALLVIMSKVGGAVFDNLPLIFAVGVAIGMAKKEKEVAALSAVIAFLVMHIAVNAMLVLNGQILADGSISEDVLEGTIASASGIQSLQMGVFGGVIVGLGVAALHNKFYKIQLPNALSFFGGTRFVPIISTLVYMFVGILMYFLWPPVQNGIYALGGLVTNSGYAGTLIFGLIKRALIPFGLHHVFYMPFWQTALGGTMDVAGQTIQGAQNIFFAQLADSANVAHFSAEATRFFSGEFIFMIFGLPGAALAMYHCAKPEKKKAAGGLLLSASLTCIATGIT